MQNDGIQAYLGLGRKRDGAIKWLPLRVGSEKNK